MSKMHARYEAGVILKMVNIVSFTHSLLIYQGQTKNIIYYKIFSRYNSSGSNMIDHTIN